MSEVLTIHKGLAELKMLDSRIKELIRSSVFISSAFNGDEKISGMTVADYKEQLRGNFDRVSSLITRRNKIKTAIMLSNASTMIEVAGKTMTVAEAIERKNSLHYNIDFLEALKRQSSLANAKVNVENEKLPAKLESYLHTILGDKAASKTDDIRALTTIFNETRVCQLIDPNQLVKILPSMEDEIFQFNTNIDAALSTSNSLTTIEI